MKKSIKRALGQGLATVLVVAGLGAFGGPASAAEPPPPPAPGAPIHGTAGFNYSGVGNPPTADKPQSKLWWNDGSWWADMWTSGGWKIHKLDRAAKQWVDTGVAVDNRANTSADTLWDGKNLYIAHHVVTISSEGGPKASRPDSPAKLYRYSYADGKYTRSSGFPTTITTNSSESMTIDKDSTGAIWATWTQVSGVPTGGYTSKVMVNNSASGGTSWGTPQTLTGENATVAPDDISSVVAFGKNKIGVMWSDHVTGSVWWASRTDGQSPTSWNVQSAVRGPNQADDHLNIKSLQADTTGRVFAAVKTSFDMNSTARKSDPQLQLLVFKPATGAFDKFTISTIGDCHTRPQIVLDPENNKIHAFQSGPATTVSGCPYSGTSGAIYQKTASMDDPVFAAGRGTPVIQDSTPSVNNVTTSKQPVTSKSGMVVLASDDDDKRYWFADFGIEGDGDDGGEYVPPAVSPFADVVTTQQFYKEICWLFENEISTGWTENGTRTYRALEPVNRDAMAAFMYRLAGKPAYTPPAVSPFTDVPPGTAYYKEINWLAAQEISTGWDEGNGIRTFRPLSPVNRDAMAAFMYRLAGEPSFTPPVASPFTDVLPGTAFYKEITWLAAQGISEGWTEEDGSKTYRALQPVNRDAMAAFMYRFNEKLDFI